MMDILFSVIRYLASFAKESSRKKIVLGLNDLAMSLESEDGAMQRIMFLVCFSLFSQ